MVNWAILRYFIFPRLSRRLILEGAGSWSVLLGRFSINNRGVGLRGGIIIIRRGRLIVF